jgi:hypothetical protein
MPKMVIEGEKGEKGEAGEREGGGEAEEGEGAGDGEGEGVGDGEGEEGEVQGEEAVGTSLISASLSTAEQTAKTKEQCSRTTVSKGSLQATET